MTTQTIDSTDLRNNMADAMKAVEAGQVLIVKRRGEDRAVLIDIDAYEDYLAAQNPEYVKSIAEARAQVKKGEIFTLEDVFGDI